MLDSFLNRITMYRLVLYYLAGLLVIAAGLGFLGKMPYNPTEIFFGTGVLVAVSWGTNEIFKNVFKSQTSIESVYITALILALIITPRIDFAGFLFIVAAGTIGVAGKYLFAINKKHIFNPAAIAVALTSMFAGQSASWWIGNK